ncbi:hypothetical protein J5N97_023254 [Dioscorea zingiberensis]|uniref:Uncharacterized protein n=1 Tax=Dioscorea zingiberensis TaxID=325984 RepID=A0A9D5CD12_9LILI|nr:hypothetical protein J5N97_023254 [Dioscorea zingiberensis]
MSCSSLAKSRVALLDHLHEEKQEKKEKENTIIGDQDVGKVMHLHGLPGSSVDNHHSIPREQYNNHGGGTSQQPPEDDDNQGNGGGSKMRVVLVVSLIIMVASMVVFGNLREVLGIEGEHEENSGKGSQEQGNGKNSNDQTDINNHHSIPRPEFGSWNDNQSQQGTNTDPDQSGNESNIQNHA